MKKKNTFTQAELTEAAEQKRDAADIRKEMEAAAQLADLQALVKQMSSVEKTLSAAYTTASSLEEQLLAAMEKGAPVKQAYVNVGIEKKILEKKMLRLEAAAQALLDKLKKG